jgi:hypothetical protein
MLTTNNPQRQSNESLSGVKILANGFRGPTVPETNHSKFSQQNRQPCNNPAWTTYFAPGSCIGLPLQVVKSRTYFAESPLCCLGNLPAAATVKRKWGH